ncbi:MAG: hypothetical protein HY074_04160 [Deltaproteobacteria bacterium]|nr:hypothetical protein [Deltaproteobacteria bacterium]
MFPILAALTTFVLLEARGQGERTEDLVILDTRAFVIPAPSSLKMIETAMADVSGILSQFVPKGAKITDVQFDSAAADPRISFLADAPIIGPFQYQTRLFQQTHRSFLFAHAAN